MSPVTMRNVRFTPTPAASYAFGQGYEVKATSTLSLTDSKALNEANITPTVLVTLQKGPSIAVCTFGAPFWELIGTAKNDPLHTPERCDVT